MLKYAYIASGMTTHFTIKYTRSVAFELNYCKGLLFIFRLIYLFMLFLTTVSVAQNTKRRLENNELAIM